MSARLIAPIARVYEKPSEKNTFFSEQDNQDLRYFESRERPQNGLRPCDASLFFGIFFDGTGNNYADSLDRDDDSQSNVARLYSAFPGQSVPGVLPPQTDWQTNLSDYDNFFRIYAPGVGTRFEAVGDSGEGFWDETLGGGTGRLGQIRILWGLAQVVNSISRYFLNRSLIYNNEVRRVSVVGEMTAYSLRRDPLSSLGAADMMDSSLKIPRALVRWLEQLHQAIRPHMAGASGEPPQNKDPGIVKNIYLSAFGFSRGAALSRVFANWLIRLCRLDASLTNSNGLTLAGFPVTFDFLGLFDTVASVGLAHLLPISDGHAGWSDAEESLAIPPEVARCLHLVSAHENRRLFPLDSIYNDRSIANNGEELVFPGVHSDLGGGYRPGSQGKGVDAIGRDMISRVPLAVMYRDARLSGVPFKLEQALPEHQVGFEMSSLLITDFNNYIDQFAVKSGETGTIIREHWRRNIEWRLDNHKKGGVSLLQSYQRASQYEKNNLLSSYSQFCEELERFAHWEDVSNRGFWRQASHAVQDYLVMGSGWIIKERGFDPSVLDDWRRISEFKSSLGAPPEAVSTMMDLYVHDSIAGFLSEWESRDEAIAYLRALVERKHMIDNHQNHYVRSYISMTSEERQRAEFYERTGQIPPMDNLGGISKPPP
ncbi:T6SS phospholipase effector Tle1-like catalytic domain-containing protein, partial [Salinicola aestuarinus]|uniref:T6SS phospholipase effector Tle1-like catalytic domain-containing protein n=1 Tax=Salinicola aestuarinus TaxID=1949082 RepID=UPI0013002148